FAPIDNDPFINIFALEPTSEASSSRSASSTESTYVTQTLYHLRKWSKDHPIDNVVDKFRANTKCGSFSTLCTPTNKELEVLFQPIFDEYLEPPRVKRPVSPAPAVPVLVDSASTLSSTSIDQDAPSLSHSSSSSALQSPCLHQGAVAESSLIDEN
nr:hypothetical protein [Tanacetum cinerariifolium]